MFHLYICHKSAKIQRKYRILSVNKMNASDSSEVIEMATANLQVRIDAALKQEAEKTLKSMSLSMSTEIHLFCRQVVNQRRIPFEIIAPDSVNETTRRSMDDTLKGKNLSRKFSSVDEMWEDLNA